MRIIAGEFRGRRLLSPADERTRPITDRVKQSLFDILSPQVAGSHVYDCFAGTGSMGLECLSRGSAHVTFFESDRSSGALLRKNIEALGVGDRATLVSQDLFRWFARADRPQPGLDLVFVDPPYRFLTDRADALQSLAGHVAAHLAAEATVIFRHDARDRLELPPLARYDQRDYGSMTIELLCLKR